MKNINTKTMLVSIALSAILLQGCASDMIAATGGFLYGEMTDHNSLDKGKSDVDLDAMAEEGAKLELDE
ncbi:MAG: hypothetical protein H0A76_08270 [Candidatus Thiodubiliella endoseptemdiera]|uniref:Uncharacterized protein n=1 Tax=Candidatus Thiodubiliella endoseptemdiera TaxID=2738886 RepID=A0A853F2Y9_9GAMM|nr:hypothetical protein [Candidatus Thiodubiliella endoseptemdiera]